MKRSSSSYAILGLLNDHPWSPYELVAYMRRSTVRLIWPRAESKLYEEPKLLAQRGWAKAKPGENSRRTIYSLTPDGQDALREWLGEPGSGLRIESEALLKILFGDSGTKQDQLAAIQDVRRDILEYSAAIDRNLVDFGLNDRYPDGQPQLALVIGFFTRLLDAVEEWASWAESRVESWPEHGTTPAMKEQALAEFRDHLEASKTRN